MRYLLLWLAMLYCLATGIVAMVVGGWAIDITPEHVKLYKPYPYYKAHTVYYSQGHTQDERGLWTVNNWKWPDYFYMEVPPPERCPEWR